MTLKLFLILSIILVNLRENFAASYYSSYNQNCEQLYYNKCRRNSDCCSRNCDKKPYNDVGICQQSITNPIVEENPGYRYPSIDVAQNDRGNCKPIFYNKCTSHKQCCSNYCAGSFCVPKPVEPVTTPKPPPPPPPPTTSKPPPPRQTPAPPPPEENVTCGLRIAKFIETDRKHSSEIRNAEKGEYPSIVSFQEEKDGGFAHFCSGVILSSRFLLSSANCFVGKKANKVFAVTNSIDILDDTNLKRWRISKVITHRQFNSKTLNHDIAVIKLRDPIRPFIKESQYPVCLPGANWNIPSNVFMTGWGLTRSNNQNKLILQNIDLQIAGTKFCENVYHDFTDNMVCAGGGKAPGDSCEGDSGAPVMNLGLEENMYVFGIVSFGDSCSPLPPKGKPAVFTKVTKYVNWINAMMSSE